METWKNDVLDSLNGMERAKPDSELLFKIKNEIASQKQRTIKSPKISWLSIAAAILILVCSNMVAIQNYFENQEADQDQNHFSISVSRDYNIYEL